MHYELRLVRPEGTSTEQSILQQRYAPDNGYWCEWHRVPVLCVPKEEFDAIKNRGRETSEKMEPIWVQINTAINELRNAEFSAGQTEEVEMQTQADLAAEHLIRLIQRIKGAK
jgi:hypothetical protein